MTKEDLIQTLATPNQYKEIWLAHPTGPSICALINGETGWLMYLQHEGDAGFSTRNPDEISTEDTTYILSNGQLDVYPKNWAYPVTKLKDALLEFIENGHLPKLLEWHDDSN